MAVTWPALSPSVLPAADTSLAPSFWPRPWRPLHLHEEGLVSVLVIEADDGLGRLCLGQTTGQGAGESRAESAKAGCVAWRCLRCWDGRFLSAPCLRGWQVNHSCRVDGIEL